jgi:hypothetical protein
LVCFKEHLARGSGSIMECLFEVLLARGSDSNLWSIFKLHPARGSGSNMGSLFKVLLARVSDPYVWTRFPNVTARVVVVRSWGLFQSSTRAWY